MTGSQFKDRQHPITENTMTPSVFRMFINARNLARVCA
jgi:hypothetical protein